jgi:hypothetical protein
LISMGAVKSGSTAGMGFSIGRYWVGVGYPLGGHGHL